MAAANKIKLQNEALNAFFDQNPDFNILHFDFHDKEAVGNLKWKGVDVDKVYKLKRQGVDVDKDKTLDELKTYQRLLRIHPDEEITGKLKAKRLDSAHKIASMSEHHFIREHARIFGGDKEKARKVHRQATQIKTKIQHLFANIHGTAASPYFRAMMANNMDPQLTNHFENIPGYQDLFGSLDYLECQHCCSVFSPAAYFLDMMRVTDEYITGPNNIDEGYKLQDRRPDLFDLQLTCENTNNLVPYLQIVNSILERRIGGDNTFQALAAAPYPFNLPFNLPLVQTRRYLGNINTTLSEIYTAFNAPITGGTARGGTKDYITLADTESGEINAYQNMYVTLVKCAGAGQVRTITHYDESTKQASVNEKWDTPPDNTSQYQIFDFIGSDREYLQLSIEQYNNLITVHNTSETAAPFYGYDSITPETLLDTLAHVETFLDRTGLKRDQLNELLVQGLSQKELKAGKANDLYIDNTGENIPYMQIVIDQSNPDNPYYKIENLTIKRLDRISRFIRLAAQLKWSYANLDWAMKSIGAAEITEQAIKSISGIKRLQDSTGFEVDVLCSFWHDMKSIGKGDGPHPLDLFDRVFNNPALLEGQDPYTSTNPIPFDPARPLGWKINDTTGQNGITRARLLGALQVSDDDLTILGNYVLRLTGIEPGQPLKLTLTNLTWLYRLAKAAAAFKMTVDEYLCLLGLMYYPDSQYLEPPANSLNPSVNNIIAQKESIDWFKRSPFTVYEVLYILAGTRTKYFSPSYKTADIASFIENLSTISEGSRFNKDSFIFGDIDAQRSKEIFDQLVEEKFFTDIGLVLKNENSYNQAANQFPLDKDSFIVKDIIKRGESRKVYKDLQNCHPPILLPLDNGTIILSQSFNKDTDLGFLFTGDKKADNKKNGDNKRNQVRSILLQIKENIGIAEFSSLSPEKKEKDEKQDAGHTAEIMNAAGNLQEGNALQGLAEFLGTTPDRLSAIIPYATNKTGLSDFLVYFLTPIKNGQVPQEIPPFIDILSRALVLFDNLAFTSDEINAVVEMPQAFNDEDTSRITLENIQSLSLFKSLKKAFNDTENSLTAYFKLPVDTGKPGAKAAALAALAGWEPDQVNKLITSFWPADKGKSDFDHTTVAGVNRLKRCFDIAGQTGMNIDSLLQFNSLGSLPLVGNWQTYTNLAGNALGAVDAKFNNEDFEKINKENTSYLETQKRNALLGYAIWVLNKDFSNIQKPSDLYQYLLIDVEMSGCDSISYIAQGIASIQLYMQRCRMMLEPGVIDLSNIPETWWEWMSSYRVWEANRKVFLYPENYLDPGLRKNQTPEFKKFAESLLQTNIDDHTISEAYINYFNDFSVVANLVHCESYNCKIPVPGSDDKTDTFFVFARTKSQPYTYYYRKFENLSAWTHWQKIDLTINSLFISPVYAFSKLFIFWVEVDTINSSKVKDNQSIPLTSVKAKIKYSYLDNSDRWIEPQTIAGDIIVDYEENYQLDQYVNKDVKDKLGIENSFDPKNIYWQKVYALYVPERSIPENQVYPKGENIFVNYGFAVKAQKGDSLKIAGVPANIPPDQLSIETNVLNLVTRYNEIVTNYHEDETSYVSFIKNINLDSNLEYSRLDTVYVNNIPGFNPQPFYPLLDRTDNKLSINKSDTYNTIIDNFYGDDYKQTNPYFSPSELDIELLDNICGKVSNVITIKNLPGSLIFDNGDEAFLVIPQDKNIQNISDVLAERTNYQSYPEDEFCFVTSDYSSPPTPFDQLQFKFYRLSTRVIDTLNKNLISGGIKSLLTKKSQETPELPFSRLKPQTETGKVISPESDKLDFNGAYGCYFWEIFFHGPFLVANTLNMNKRFRDAKDWYQYIFDPTRQPEDGGEGETDMKRFWRFLPFRTMNLETLTQILTNPAQIEEYNNDPFDPDAIARLRISAYAKAIVMKYIDNLLDWGDYLFTQDTRESITQATNLYVMASDLLGPRPEAVGNYPVPAPMSFNQIKAKYPGDIPEFLIHAENSTLLSGDGDDLQFEQLPFNDIDSYFCVPENQEFTAYWDRVEDRLYKIRHCMNIKGQVRTLAQFEPPINPRELIRAVSSGGSLAQAIYPDVNVPWYRFPLMIEKARSLTSILEQLGGSLLAALEKKDAEALALLRSSQEKTLLNMTTSIKEQQIEELIKMKDSLEESLKSATRRSDYYRDLIDKGLSPAEIANIVGMTSAMVSNVLGGITKTAASLAYAIPQVGSPFAMTYGGQQLGAVLNAASGVHEIFAVVSNFVAQLSLTMAGYERRGQEWQLQADLADFDREQIIYQVQANEIRQKISERELEIHQTTILQNQEMEEFLKNKFTNRELYQWMVTRLSTVYFQTYSLAFQLALAAQRAYQFELDSNQSFVNFGYWDSLNKGLLAGEGLMLALNQMEKSYLDNNWRRLEIEKTISLMQLDPKALLDLKENGECTFNFSEKIFDDDYPGHYARKIKTISISIPAVVGPYQNINATLTQMSNQVVIKPDVNAVNFLLGGAEASMPEADTLRSNWLINQQIAVSRGVDDTGMFQLNFNDERYLPFEGTGAVSSWRLSMPKATNRIDFENISDVIIRLMYTASDGGSKFREEVIGLKAMKPYYGSNFFSLARMFPGQWYSFLHDHDPASTDTQEMEFSLANPVPPHIGSPLLTGFYFKLDVPEGINTKGTANYIKLKLTDSLVIDFNLDQNGGYMHSFTTQPPMADVEGNRSVTFTLAGTPEDLKTGTDPCYLNAEVVKDIVLILFYKGEIQWSKK